MISSLFSNWRSFFKVSRPVAEQRTWTKFGLYREERFRTFEDLC